MKQGKWYNFFAFLTTKRGETQKLTPKYTIYWPLAKKLRAGVHLKGA